VYRYREFQFEADYDKVIHLWETAGAGIHVSTSDSPHEIAKKLARDPDLFLICIHEDKIIGTVLGGYDGRRGIIYHLAVDTAYRGQGIAKELMAVVEKRLRAKGCIRCYLLVTKDNSNAIQFYEHHGWESMDFIQVYGKNL
jgi:ribosomal protein S18 acetylase RimI-like enzyme